MVGVGRACREPRPDMTAQGWGTQCLGLGMDTSQHGLGEAGPGAQARGAQIFLLPSRGRLDGYGREPWFKQPGSESGLPLRCLWRVTQPL